MSSPIAVTVIVEGKTEALFVQHVLAPHVGARNIFMTPIEVSKPGQKGGDVRFVRVRKDIVRQLKQRSDTYVSLIVDYYGIGRDWPGLDGIPKDAAPDEIATAICTATKAAIIGDAEKYGAERRFVPYISVHEFEALLFSDAAILAHGLQVDVQLIKAILKECGEPERIDNSPYSAPSKRLERLSNRFKKTTNGIVIAQATGVETMRRQCPVFNGWLAKLESLRTAPPSR